MLFILIKYDDSFKDNEENNGLNAQFVPNMYTKL